MYTWGIYWGFELRQFKNYLKTGDSQIQNLKVI